MTIKNDSLFEWRLPGPVATDSGKINAELEKYTYGDILVIPERLTEVDEDGYIYYSGEKIGSKDFHPFFGWDIAGRPK